MNQNKDIVRNNFYFQLAQLVCNLLKFVTNFIVNQSISFKTIFADLLFPGANVIKIDVPITLRVGEPTQFTYTVSQ